jgi:hypothetical protein
MQSDGTDDCYGLGEESFELRVKSVDCKAS